MGKRGRKRAPQGERKRPAAAKEREAAPAGREWPEGLVDIGRDLPEVSDDDADLICESVLSPESANGTWLETLPLEERAPAFERILRIERACRNPDGEEGPSRAAVLAWMLQWTVLLGSPPEAEHVHARFGEAEVEELFGGYEALYETLWARRRRPARAEGRAV
jgi:hypothetical protein